MGVWGSIAQRKYNMKYNYIFNSVDTDKIPKLKENNIPIKNWRNKLKRQLAKDIPLKERKFFKKIRKEREYKKRIPKKYILYIKSKFWKTRRNKYFRDYGKKCMVCGSCKYVQLHHIEYRNSDFGFEEDKTLIALCRDCHEEFHLRYRTKQNMQKEVEEFIQIKQQWN